MFSINSIASMSRCELNPLAQNEGSLVERVLEQGQRLRNSIVQSILNNDPFNTEIMTNQITLMDSPNGPQLSKRYESSPIDNQSQEKLEAYLQGESMPREDELQVLNIIQSMSSAELCKTTDQAFSSDKFCNCRICNKYVREEVNCDLKRACPNRNSHKVPSSAITDQIQESYRSQTGEYLKYVDSLQIGVHNLVLNDVGIRKASASETTKPMKLPLSVNYTYFIEYRVPDVLSGTTKKTTFSTTDANLVRICSNRLHNEG